MSGTLCPEHYEPLLLSDVEWPVFAMWPISACVICGKQPPGYEAIGKEKWVLVDDNAIAEVRKLLQK